MTPKTPPAVDVVQDVVRDVVRKVLRSVLGDEGYLTADTQLFHVAGFDSLALAAVVEGLEAELGLALPDELITPEAFVTPDDIARKLVVPALRGDIAS